MSQIPPIPPLQPLDYSANPANATPEESKWAAFTHISALSGLIVPFGQVIGPLIFWLIKKDELPFVNDQGKEAINFNLSILLYAIISIALMLVFIGFILIFAVTIFWFICVVIGTVKAAGGTPYRYPLTIRLLS